MRKTTHKRLDTTTVATLIDHSEQRKKTLRQDNSDNGTSFGGASGRQYSSIIDAYHGETGLPLDISAKHALRQAWDELLTKSLPVDYSDDKLYDKRQPLILQQLAADNLFSRLYYPTPEITGIKVRPEEVIVCPYSSMVLIEEALATIARPNGVVVCPEGFYKNFGLSARKLGLQIITCPNAADNTFKVDAEALAVCLQGVRSTGNLCGVLLTLPGNPVVSNYTLKELIAIGRTLIDANVPILLDMGFDRLVSDYVPLASLRIPTPNGEIRLYDRILSITGNSKGYNAFGPCKIGAACTGDQTWLKLLYDRLTVSFQRETTHIARAVIAHTKDAYFERNRQLMHTQYVIALDHIRQINQRFGNVLQPLGSPEGIFMGLCFDSTLLQTANITTSSKLEEALLQSVGVDSVALARTGSPRLGLRLNIFAPRKYVGQERQTLVDELFYRIEEFIESIQG